MEQLERGEAARIKAGRRSEVGKASRMEAARQVAAQAAHVSPEMRATTEEALIAADAA